MKRLICLALALLLLAPGARAWEEFDEGPWEAVPALQAVEDLPLTVPSAVLMEKETGELLYEKGAHERMLPASVTKVMTMLLVTEAIEEGRIKPEDMVTASAKASSMGGSQIWLEEGERMSVSDMLKCVAVVSANDCAVALAEYISGSEEVFVQRMNERAAELEMRDTHFTNCTGLFDDDTHYTSAYDIAVMSRELILHDSIKKYTTVWMDTIRDGEFGLSNTNKLIHYYDGATGLKTGFTSKAMYCLSGTAERDGVEYIAVVLHADTSADRFDSAKALLSYGFANYDVVSLRPQEALPPVLVTLGSSESVQPVYAGPDTVLEEKGILSRLSYEIELPQTVAAPVDEGQILGTLTVKSGDELLAQIDIIAPDTVPRLSYKDILCRMLATLIGRKV